MDGLDNVKQTLRNIFLQHGWWKFVQPEVRRALFKIIESMEETGSLFKNAYLALFKLEHLRRLKKGVASHSSEPSPLFGKSLPEECYLSGIRAAKILLDVDEWVEPNDADIHACMILCQQIEMLESIGVIKRDLVLEENIQDIVDHMIKAANEKG